MKTVAKIALASVVSSVLAVSANAALTYGASNTGKAYVGVKATQVDPSVYQINKKTTNYGVYGGYQFDQNTGTEFEYQGGSAKDYAINGVRYEYDVKAYGAYGTYRYAFNNTPVYAKGKIGVGVTEVKDESKDSNSWRAKTTTTGLAGGAALGFAPAQNLGVELGYNYLSKDAKGVSLGAHVAF